MLLAIQNLELEFPHFIGDYLTEKKEEVLTDRMMLESLNSFSEKARKVYANRLNLGSSYIKFDARTNQFKWK